MSRQNFKAPRLPKELLEKVQTNGATGRSRYGRKKAGPLGRKEQRKALREQKKVSKPHPRHTLTAGAPEDNNGHSSSDDNAFNEEIDESEDELEPQPPRKKAKLEPEKPQKSILKTHPKIPDIERSPSPRPHISRSIRSALEQDDAEIAFLEKKLGLKGKKLSRSDDGLDDLLGGIDELVGLSEKSKSKKADEDWLQLKRKPTAPPNELDVISSGDDMDESDEFEGLRTESENEFKLDDGSVGDLVANGDKDDDEDEEDLDLSGDELDVPSVYDESIMDLEEANSEVNRNTRENPYRPPIPGSSKPMPKYIPPSLRGPAKDDQDIIIRLKRQLQGLLNRLSDANILSIVRDIERVLNSNPRQHVISSLIDLLIGLICDRSGLMDTFVILHAAFIAATYKIIGPHFGAQMLETVVSQFRHYYEDQKQVENPTKESSNLIALLAEMYTFQVVSSTIIFDYIRLLLSDLSNLNTELLLKLIKNCGPQLRSDDPLALKDIVLLLQKAVTAKGGEAKLPVRTRFMIETISSLKNNKIRTGPPGANISSEHVVRLKKTLGSLNSRSAKSTEPLNVGLRDIEKADKDGKWWLVGSSWRHDIEGEQHDPQSGDPMAEKQEQELTLNEDEQNEITLADLSALAKQHRMNTDIRRTIFLAIMSSTDYKDAYLRLRRLRLKRVQQFEIPRILLHCAASEKIYNPYYRLIAKKLCAEHKFRKAMQFNLWSIFRRCGEKDSMNDDDSDVDQMDEQEDQEIGLREIVNLAKLFGELIGAGALLITVLKILNFVYLHEKTKTFLEVLLVTVMQTTEKRYKSDDERRSSIKEIFAKAKDVPDMVPGLQYFLSHSVKTSSLAATSAERNTLKRCCEVAAEAIALLDYCQ